MAYVLLEIGIPGVTTAAGSFPENYHAGLRLVSGDEAAYDPPVVDAGDDQTVVGPSPTTVSMDGSVTSDAPGVDALWTKVSGPTGFAFDDDTDPASDVTFTASGTYVFRLTADDGVNSPVSDDVTFVMTLALWKRVMFVEDLSALSGLPDIPFTRGDLLIGNSGGSLTKLAKGASGKILKMGADDPAWEDEAGGSGGVLAEDVVLTDTLANIPAAGTVGRIFLPSDGLQVYRDSGTVWEKWAGLSKLSLPVAADFTWVNQGSATLVDENGRLTISNAAEGGAHIHALVKNAPATPYTITTRLTWMAPPLNYATVGLCFYESSSGKIHACFLGFTNGWALRSAKFTDVTTYSADYTSFLNLLVANPIYLRIQDTGANRIYSASLNGKTWWLLHSVGRTDFLTADKVGWFVDCEQTQWDCGLSLEWWSETS